MAAAYGARGNTEGVPRAVSPLFGREEELSEIRELFASESADALLIDGVAGQGKTALWAEAVADLERNGASVLTARSAAAETTMSFSSLIDLLDGVDVHRESLPTPQAAALDAALLRSAPAERLEEGLVAVALLNLLRDHAAAAQANGTQLVLAIDDIQWVDRDSLSALRYVVRRLPDAVRLLMTRRIGTTAPLLDDLRSDRLQRLDLPPLSIGATKQALKLHLRITVGRGAMRRIYAEAGGNPLLALEFTRHAHRHGLLDDGSDGPIGVPDSLEALLEVRVSALPEPQQQLLLALSLAGELPTAAASGIVGEEAIRAAATAAVVELVGGRVRAAHPLYASTARHHALPEELRAAHAALSKVHPDPLAQVLHRTRAALDPEPELAAAAELAAETASAGGRLEDTIDLMTEAVRLSEATADQVDRELALAELLIAALRHEAAGDLLDRLEGHPEPLVRARAFLSRSRMTAGVTQTTAVLERAEADSAADPALRRQIMGKRATNAVLGGARDVNVWLAWATSKDRDAEMIADCDGLLRQQIAWVLALAGQPLSELLASDSSNAGMLMDSAERAGVAALNFAGRVSESRSLSMRLRGQAERGGQTTAAFCYDLHLAEAAFRAGDLAGAEEAIRSMSDADDSLEFKVVIARCRALLAAHRGDIELVHTDVGHAEALVADSGLTWNLHEVRRARGLIALLQHDAAAAAEAFGPVWEHTEREGIHNPGVFPVAGDLVEALTQLGRVTEAEEVADILERRSVEQEHPWGLATARRCRGVLAAARGETDDAIANLDGAAAAYDALGLRFEAARTREVAGAAARRAGRRRIARELLTAAVAEYDAIGAAGWSERASAELARIGGRSATPDRGLTQSEQKVADLAAAGHTNKQIAAELWISVHTVEAHLSKAYGKLGIRSRARLAAKLAEAGSGGSSS